MHELELLTNSNIEVSWVEDEATCEENFATKHGRARPREEEEDQRTQQHLLFKLMK